MSPHTDEVQKYEESQRKKNRSELMPIAIVVIIVAIMIVCIIVSAPWWVQYVEAVPS